MTGATVTVWSRFATASRVSTTTGRRRFGGAEFVQPEIAAPDYSGHGAARLRPALEVLADGREVGAVTAGVRLVDPARLPTAEIRLDDAADRFRTTQPAHDFVGVQTIQEIRSEVDLYSLHQGIIP